ncbi:hypothetical protein A4H97_11495 [Niastella yeongjuensis]|uniref:Uncharacterized protein n=1 Tax=Niastella yeongjuensis TaxID=354355 RepID=A0A1V9E9L6_9BACT|nr:hypothetical protein [Niastella yeongjuensis]OQP42781.1 hypothetical protein A4H97_11495 [Niastella yeongjuensis]SEO53638.1 hypothetical protein SAMN05660816_02967 [Niastella yeongjuensis]
MNIQRRILFKSLVTPFYRQNAALLVFVYYMMTLAIGRANGVGLLEYHYSLIRGMLTNAPFLLAVLGLWLTYAIKCGQFVTNTLQKPAFSYLYQLSLLNVRKVYWLLLQVQLMLFLPVLSYLVAVMGIGYHEHWIPFANLAFLFVVFVCAVCAGWYLYLLQRQGEFPFVIKWKLSSLLIRKSYSQFLVRYVLEKGKLLFFVTKLYNCASLYLMLDGRDPARHTDIRMMALFFSAGMLGHGILVHRLKEMENTGLSFYRSLPVPVSRRFAQYGWFYFYLFIPEIIAIISRTPSCLTYAEAGFFIFFGYGILLLLNSLQLYNYTNLKNYLVNVAQLFFAVIIAMVTRQLLTLSIIFFVLAIILFFHRYYRFEPQQNPDL